MPTSIENIETAFLANCNLLSNVPARDSKVLNALPVTNDSLDTFAMFSFKLASELANSPIAGASVPNPNKPDNNCDCLIELKLPNTSKKFNKASLGLVLIS